MWKRKHIFDYNLYSWSMFWWTGSLKTDLRVGYFTYNESAHACASLNKLLNFQRPKGVYSLKWTYCATDQGLLITVMSVFQLNCGFKGILLCHLNKDFLWLAFLSLNSKKSPRSLHISILSRLSNYLSPLST